jgi:hypothetical protein
MQITVSAGNHLSGICEENRFRGINGPQIPPVHSGTGNQFNPFNPMFFLDGLRYGDYTHLIATIYFFKHWHMFFLSCINAVFHHHIHRLTATSQFTGTGVQYLNDIATEGAFIYFVFFRHNESPVFMCYKKWLHGITLNIFPDRSFT